MEKIKIPTRLFLFLLLTALTGCGHQYLSARSASPQKISGISSVAVLPFENLTKFYQAGQIVPDLLATELYRLRRVKVMERAEAVAVCAGLGIQIPKAIDAQYARVLGEKLGVDGVIIGSVTEYWYRVYREEDEDVEPAVGINARLVSVATGEVLWAASVTRSSYDMFLSQKDPLNRVAQLAVVEMLKSLR